MTQRSQVRVQPLGRGDPPMLGDVMLRGRLGSSDAGIVYAGQLVDEPVAVVLLSTAPRWTPSRCTVRGGRRPLADEDGSDHEVGGVLACERAGDVAPWFAIAAGDAWSNGLDASRRLLDAVTLDDVAPVGAVRGPGAARTGTGVAASAAGVSGPCRGPRHWAPPDWTFVAAFALMVGIASMVLWIAVLIYHTQPPAPRPPQVTRTSVPPPAPMTLPKPQTNGPHRSGQPTDRGIAGPEASGSAHRVAGLEASIQ